MPQPQRVPVQPPPPPSGDPNIDQIQGGINTVLHPDSFVQEPGSIVRQLIAMLTGVLGRGPIVIPPPQNDLQLGGDNATFTAPAGARDIPLPNPSGQVDPRLLRK